MNTMEDIDRKSNFNNLYGHYCKIDKVKEWCNDKSYEFVISFTEDELEFMVNNCGTQIFKSHDINSAYRWCVEQDQENVWHKFPKTWDDLPEEHKGEIVVCKLYNGKITVRGIFSKGDYLSSRKIIHSPSSLMVVYIEPDEGGCTCCGNTAQYALYSDYDKSKN